MKKFKKIITLVLAFVFCIPMPLIFTACKDNNNPPTNISAKQVINESVARTEELVFANDESNVNQQSQISYVAFVAPNLEVNYLHELKSVFSGAGIALYFTDYIINYLDNFELNKTYKDEIQNVGMTTYFKAKEITDGIETIYMAEINGNKNIIKTYYIYDYQNKKPRAVITISESKGSCDLVKFDFQTGIAYNYSIKGLPTSSETINAALTQKSLDFEAFKALDISGYNFAKFDLLNNTKEAYSYAEYGESVIDVTESQVGVLYNEIYNSVKNYAVPTGEFDTTNTISVVYYQKMYIYTRNKSTVDIIDGSLRKTALEYDETKLLLSQIKTKLQDEQYSEYTELKTLVAAACTYIELLGEDKFIGLLDSVGSLSIIAIGERENGYKYQLSTMLAEVSIIVNNGEIVEFEVNG